VPSTPIVHVDITRYLNASTVGSGDSSSMVCSATVLFSPAHIPYRTRDQRHFNLKQAQHEGNGSCTRPRLSYRICHCQLDYDLEPCTARTNRPEFGGAPHTAAVLVNGRQPCKQPRSLSKTRATLLVLRVVWYKTSQTRSLGGETHSTTPPTW